MALRATKIDEDALRHFTVVGQAIVLCGLPLRPGPVDTSACATSRIVV